MHVHAATDFLQLETSVREAQAAGDRLTHRRQMRDNRASGGIAMTPSSRFDRCRLIWPLAFTGALAACSTPELFPSQSPSADASQRASTQVTQAAATPFSDLNLVRAAIPPVLLEAQKKPYAEPEDVTCPGLSALVRALDEVLGPDLDTPATEANPGLLERGGGLAEEAGGSALKGAAEGLVPFRGWVRRLSGAERYSRSVAAAIAAGTVRRSYLKGLGEARGCAPPAAPRSPVMPE
jgi:hypothetical protein